MALKSREWFLGQCYEEVRRVGRLAFLANRALELGLSNKDNTVGHVLQACGAAQKFFDQYPPHKSIVRGASPGEPYRPVGTVLRHWRGFFRTKTRSYGRANWGYNWDVLHSILTVKYGGLTRGGGGGDNEFEIVLRLMAEFM